MTLAFKAAQTGLFKTGRPVPCPDSDAAIRFFKMERDPFGFFLHDCLEAGGPEDFIIPKHVKLAYRWYCDDNGLAEKKVVGANSALKTCFPDAQTVRKNLKAFGEGVPYVTFAFDSNRICSRFCHGKFRTLLPVLKERAVEKSRNGS